MEQMEQLSNSVDLDTTIKSVAVSLMGIVAGGMAGGMVRGHLLGRTGLQRGQSINTMMLVGAFVGGIGARFLRQGVATHRKRGRKRKKIDETHAGQRGVRVRHASEIRSGPTL